MAALLSIADYELVHLNRVDIMAYDGAELIEGDFTYSLLEFFLKTYNPAGNMPSGLMISILPPC